MDATQRSALVVGGGIFGVTAALALARRGWGVRILDPGPLPHPDAATTDVSKLVRPDYGADELYTGLAEEALEGWERWNRDAGRPLFHRDGFLLLARGWEPGGFEYESHRTLAGRGHELRRLDRAAVRRDFPSWNAGRFPAGYLNPAAGWAASAEVLAWLVGRARRAGVTVETGRRATELVEEGGDRAGVRTDDGRLHRADRVVVAAGAWTPGIVPGLREVMWATGQPVLHFRVDEPARWRPPAFPPWAADIAGTGWYGFPALDDGTLKVAHHGPGRRVDPLEPRIVEPAWEARCREFLAGAVPELADAPLVRTRLCLYCDTFDGDFWIDRDPDREGLVVAAGGSGHAFKFAPLLGELVAGVVEETPDPRARRFRWRPPGEARGEAARADTTPG